MGDRPPAGHYVRKAIEDEQLSRRHLPHIEKPESTYFVTFRVRKGELSPSERDQVLSACKYWHGAKMTLHCASVMPDHVHLLLTPLEEKTGRWVPLGELLKSIKNYSALQINRERGTHGSLWLDENFDRIIRNERDFHERWDYICQNPVTTGLVPEAEQYQWFWRSGCGYGELAGSEESTNLSDRPEAGPPDWSEAGPPVQTGAACCFIKHTNACGAAIEADRIESYRKAYLGDPNAAMGGILAVNFDVDAAFAEAVMETYRAGASRPERAGSSSRSGSRRHLTIKRLKSSEPERNGASACVCWPSAI